MDPKETNATDFASPSSREDAIDVTIQYESKERRSFTKTNPGMKPQADAFAFADERGGIPVHTKQLSPKNYSWIVQGWQSFFDEYVSLKKEDRVMFEIIRETIPIKFYVDAELYRDKNPIFSPGSEAETRIIDETRRSCKEGIMRCFPQITEDLIEIYEMDSSDDKKLSVRMHPLLPSLPISNLLPLHKKRKKDRLRVIDRHIDSRHVGALYHQDTRTRSGRLQDRRGDLR
jgi:hypothetical protein